MSERALAYGTEPLSHRFLVLFEAAGLESDFASYLVRSLLSEGCVRYETVEKGKDGELKARLVEREGPTGLIVSTTSVALHPENETRLLSLAATDTPDQTKLVLSRLADRRPRRSPTSPAGTTSRSGSRPPSTASRSPTRTTLAELVPPVAVRLRRDFRAVLSLIRSHAILHQASRERDADGKVIATLEDYAIVRELVVDSSPRASRRPCPTTVRETVEAVAALPTRSRSRSPRWRSAARTSTSRRPRALEDARARGYLKNLEDRTRQAGPDRARRPAPRRRRGAPDRRRAAPQPGRPGSGSERHTPSPSTRRCPGRSRNPRRTRAADQRQPLPLLPARTPRTHPVADRRGDVVVPG